MNGNFKVGEVLVGQSHILQAHKNGMECTVTGALAMRSAISLSTGEITIGERYEVRWANGELGAARPMYLRRKQPPSGELSILNMFVVAPPQRTKEIA